MDPPAAFLLLRYQPQILNEMKKIILYAAAALALVSCDKYLNQYPHNAVASDNLTEDDAEMLMTGVYNGIFSPVFSAFSLSFSLMSCFPA